MTMSPTTLRQLALLADRLSPGYSLTCTCQRWLHASSRSAVESSGPTTAPAASAAAATALSASPPSASHDPLDSLPAAAASWMYKTVKQKNNMSTAEYLEFKSKSWFAKITFWEKFYYAAGLVGAGLLVYTKVDWDGSKARKAEAAKRKAEELEAKRLEAVPLFLSGRSFVSEDDDHPFEGASPGEIQALADKVRASQAAVQGSSRWKLPVFAEDDDPFEGMTPEEIDEYIQRKRSQQ